MKTKITDNTLHGVDENGHLFTPTTFCVNGEEELPATANNGDEAIDLSDGKRYLFDAENHEWLAQ